MYENIEANRPNFCIGPQAGTFCTVDNEVSPVVMQVKNDSGSLISTYSFYPLDVLDTGPYSYPSSLPTASTYPFHEFVNIQYVGPYGQTSYFNGAVFYTLERRAFGLREYYTHTNENDPLDTSDRPEFRSNIIRRWKIDSVNFRLILDKTFIKESDVDDWFDANAFAIQHTSTTFDWHTPAGTGSIEVTTTSGLKKYDTLFLGPSSDASNYGAVEEVYVHSVSGTTVEIKTYTGVIPTEWEYMEDDPITFYQDIFLFSNSRPLINAEDIAYGHETTSGTLYRLDQTNYGATVDTNYNGIYQDVFVSTWNNFYSVISFVKGTNLLHLTSTDYELMRSQDIHLENPNTQSIIPIYDIDIKDTSIYKLQKSILQHGDSGDYFEITWTKYNYHVDTFSPYANSVALTVSERILLPAGQAFISLIVRDQFGVGLLGKEAWFTAVGDIGGELTPSDGYMTTDADGKVSIQYDAGNNYAGHEEIAVKVNGGNSVHGSIFLAATSLIQQYIEHDAVCFIRTSILDSFNINIQALLAFDAGVLISTLVAYTFPGNTLTNNDISGWIGRINDEVPLIFAQKVPTISSDELSGAEDQRSVSLAAYNLFLNDNLNESDQQTVNVYSKSLIQSDRQISANFISRHLTYGHADTVILEQFIFVQDARPAMWSEKNNVNTDYWIRLRPFAASLNPASLVVKFREVSYLGDSGWEDVTSFGTITMFDAGGGLLGIDFLYYPATVFHHNAIIYIDIEVYDTAAVPNIIVLEYWFKIIPDYKSPYITNRLPGIEEYDVPIYTNITFDIIDTGAGVDIRTLEVFINQRSVPFTHDEYEPGNYHILCNPEYNFTFGQTVNITVNVFDKSANSNRLLDGWKFYCIESSGPWFNMDNTEPRLCNDGLERKQPVSLQVYGIDDTGIKYDSIRMEVGGRYRNIRITPIVYRIS